MQEKRLITMDLHKRKLKKHKWYSTSIKPDVSYGLIVMTDMGYMFEAIYEDNLFKLSVMKDYKVYYEPYLSQDSLVKWMKV